MFVVAVNILSILFLYGAILEWFNAFLVVLGILTTCFAAIMLADYFFVRRLIPDADPETAIESVNWAGVIALVAGFAAAHYAFVDKNPIEFLTAIAVSAIVYPVLRCTLLRPRRHLSGSRDDFGRITDSAIHHPRRRCAPGPSTIRQAV